MGLVSQQTLCSPHSLSEATINETLKRILKERREQAEQISKVKSELDVKKRHTGGICGLKHERANERLTTLLNKIDKIVMVERDETIDVHFKLSFLSIYQW
jgi:hypothetical protein